MYQMDPTTTYQDNKSTITIAKNRGSLGPTSRAIDLDVLCVRNRIEDHQIETKYIRTEFMVADMGTKALSGKTFVRHRDMANGYSLVKAAYPDFPLPDCVHSGPPNGNKCFTDYQKAVMMIPHLSVEEVQHDL